MWTLEKVDAKNICAFKDLSYSPAKNCTTLIFGNNLDNDSQGSNGSGKSALIEAIAVGITGDSLRKVKSEEIVNDGEEYASVSLVFKNLEINSEFIVSRTIRRNATQVIETILNSEVVVQPSVNDYNRYVLDVIGISREDLLSNFILSKHKYASFLSASDRDKKDFINRFSNGNLVDVARESLAADTKAAEDSLREIEKEEAQVNGKVAAIDEQIEAAYQNREKNELRKAEIIAAHEESITKYRGKIREAHKEQEEIAHRIEELLLVDKALATEEDTQAAIEETYANLKTLFKEEGLPSIANYSDTNNKLAQKLQGYSEEIAELSVSVKALKKNLDKAEGERATLVEELEITQNSNAPKTKSRTLKLKNAKDQMAQLEKISDEYRAELIKLDEKLVELNKIMNGAVECPKCKHRFLPVTESMSLEEAGVLKSRATNQRYEVIRNNKSNQAQIESVNATIRETSSELQEMAAKEMDLIERSKAAQTNHAKLAQEYNELLANYNASKRYLASTQERIADVRKNMFDEAFEILDEEIEANEKKNKTLQLSIESWKQSIAHYKEELQQAQSITVESMVEGLEQKKTEYNEMLDEVLKKKVQAKQKLDNFKAQEVRFLDFKTHLANSKIDALAGMTNQFLETIGSDIRIALSGFTMLKSGKVRDKISVSVLRDGIDCGSLAKMSQGEQCRINLASILALRNLINVNCAEGKGLDLLVLDEILDATDEAGLASMFDALNQLQITAMVVTHGLTQENYPHKLIITKHNGISTLQ